MKPSWTDIAAFGLLLFFALVMANGWPSGDWALGWSAIGAVGTIVTGGIAARIAYVQYQDHQLAKQRKHYHALSSLRDRVWQVERCLIKLAHMVELASIGLVYRGPDRALVDEDEILEYLADDRAWPKLDAFDIFDNSELDLMKERSDFQSLKDMVHDLRSVHYDYIAPLVGASTTSEIVSGLKRLLTKAKKVAGVIDLFDRGGRERNFALESIGNTQKTMLELAEKF